TRSPECGSRGCRMALRYRRRSARRYCATGGSAPPVARHRLLRLLAAPLRRSLAEEGADALLGVLAAESGRKTLLLGLDALVEVTGVGDELDLLDRERGLGGELVPPHQGGLEQLVIGDDAVDEA